MSDKDDAVRDACLVLSGLVDALDLLPEAGNEFSEERAELQEQIRGIMVTAWPDDIDSLVDAQKYEDGETMRSIIRSVVSTERLDQLFS